jgi:hypothetical protein
MRKLNNVGHVSGFGPFEEHDGKITNREEALAATEIAEAFIQGLTWSLSKKALVRTHDCELAVFVDSCRNLRVSMFKETVERVTSKLPRDNFTHVHVFGSEEGYYTRVR